MTGYAYQRQPFIRPPELDGASSCAPVAIIGAGPIGLAAAIDLALHGVSSIVLDDNDVVSVGSRAICWAKRTLEICDRLGVGERMLAKGVTWKVGRLFHGEEEVYSFDLLPEDGHKFPAFINLQQYYLEEYLIDRARDFPDLIDLRFKNKVAGIDQSPDGVELQIETPEGSYRLSAQYALACDGARSDARRMLGLELDGESFEERFLIADIRMEADFPSERWFWFKPTFHPGQSALLHKQPDNIYRIDLQLGWDADPELEKTPERVIPRIEQVVDGRPFELDWVSVYSFQCSRLDQFVHGRVIFLGDSAHVVSPFGARGGNGGMHDVDNLCWKLAAILRGDASERLLASYNEERGHGAAENLANSARTTRFMSPQNGAERRYRDEVLSMARRLPFARRMVNSGRLSAPCSLEGLALQTPPSTSAAAAARPGLAALDAPLADRDGAPTWLLEHIGGAFKILAIGVDAPSMGIDIVKIGEGGFSDRSGWAEKRYGRGLFLIRPDQHMAASWPESAGAPTVTEISAALERALGMAAA